LAEATGTSTLKDDLLFLAPHHRVAFANAYPPIFFERLAHNTARRTATSYAVQAAGVRYRGIEDLRYGRAVSAFVTNQIWREHGADVPLITAHDAGRNLARLAQRIERLDCRRAVRSRT
jgi:hypothetical protein